MTALLNIIKMQPSNKKWEFSPYVQLNFSVVACHRPIFFISQAVYFIEPISTEGRADTAGKQY
jgi:hypothetical protein